MEKILNDYFKTVSQDELAAFDAELGSIAARCETEDTEAVLSGAMRRAGISKRRFTLRKRLAIMLAAALILIPASVAFASYVNKLDVFFGIKNEGSPLANEFYKNGGITAENENAKLVLDGVLSDDVSSYVVFSFYAKNEKGREHIYDMKHYGETDDTPGGHGDKDSLRRQSDAMLSYLNVWSNAGAGQYYDQWNNFVFWQEHKGVIKDQPYKNSIIYDDDNRACYFKVVIKNDRVDMSKPIHIVETLSGLELEVDLTENLEKVRLVSDDAECFHNVTLTPLAVYIRYDERDIKNPGSVHAHECTVKLLDGSSLTAKVEADVLVINGDDFEKDWAEGGKQSGTDIRFASPIDPAQFESIEIDGKVYRPSKEADLSDLFDDTEIARHK